MILSAETIRDRVGIEPFSERCVHLGTGMSYGLSVAGYDVRVREGVMLYPGKFCLASILEHITMPEDVMGFILDKSTLARLGTALFNTVVEPGWRGYLTVEIKNNGEERLILPPGAPIAQIIFFRVDGPCVPYRGKYQDQPPHPVGARREELE